MDQLIRVELLSATPTDQESIPADSYSEAIETQSNSPDLEYTEDVLSFPTPQRSSSPSTSVSAQNTSSASSKKSLFSNPAPSRKRAKVLDNLDAAVLKCLEKEDDGDECFAGFIVAELKTIDEPRRSQVKVKLCQCIMNEKCNIVTEQQINTQ